MRSFECLAAKSAARLWPPNWRVRLLSVIAAAGFAIAILLVLLAAFALDRYGASLQSGLAAEARESQALIDVIDLEHHLTDAMSGARGFLLSGNRRNLATYAAGADAARSLLDRIQSEQAETGRSKALMVRQARAHLDFLQSIVSNAEQGQRELATAQAGADLGQAAKMAVEAEIHARRAEVNQLVLARRASIETVLGDARRFNWLAAVVMVCMLMAFGALLRHRFHQREHAADVLATANAKLEETVRRRTTELADLSQHLLSVREEERAELARNIHDQIGSELAALRMDLTRLENAGTRQGAPPDPAWPRIKMALDELTTAHRRIINSLHPTILDHLGLDMAIRELLKDMLHGDAPAHELAVVGSLNDLPPAVAIAAYRVVQEALSNVLKHAKAKHVNLLLRRDGGVLTVQITDDGIGIAARPAEKGRLGLVGMRERAHNLGGSLEVRRGPGNVGTRLTARFSTASPAGATQP